MSSDLDEQEVARVLDLYERICKAARGHLLSDAAKLAKKLPAGDLVGYPYHVCYWHCVEPVANFVVSKDPDLAERLMELVVQSHYKEASGATSGGEGLRMMADVRRVLTRRDGLQRRAAAVRALFAETEKA